MNSFNMFLRFIHFATCSCNSQQWRIPSMKYHNWFTCSSVDSHWIGSAAPGPWNTGALNILVHVTWFPKARISPVYLWVRVDVHTSSALVDNGRDFCQYTFLLVDITLFFFMSLSTLDVIFKFLQIWQEWSHIFLWSYFAFSLLLRRLVSFFSVY